MDISEGDLEAVEKEYRMKWEEDQEVTRYQSLISRGGDMIQKVKSGQVSIGDLRQFVNDKITIESNLIGTDPPAPLDINEVFQMIQEAPAGLNSGYDVLDRFVEFCPSELIVIAARPRHGKTTLAINIFLNMIEKYAEQPFVFFSYEMNMEQILIKLIGSRTGEGFKGIKNNIREGLLNNNQAKVLDLFREYSQGSRLYVVNKPRWDVSRLISYCRGIKEEAGAIGAVFVDYIGLVADMGGGDRDSTEQRYSRVVHALRIASQELNCPIIALSQMSREGVKGKTAKSRYPSLDQLRYSGRIEQEAATVLAIYNQTEDEKREGDEVGQDEDYGVVGSQAQLWLFNLKSRFGPGNKPLPFVMTQGNKIEELKD
jgi:replicative DNA helicase